ncbi:MAG: hypothetical protein ACREHD_25185 [Pirellulales bacterium]
MADDRTILAQRIQSGAATLLAAFDYAQDCALDRWQFAVALPEILAEGATLVDLRWLILRGFAEHAIETTIPGDATRSFRRLPQTCLPADMCIVLSPHGAEALRSLVPGDRDEATPATAGTPTRVSMESSNFAARPLPEWDAARRELRYRDQVVKRYRVPAPNQELVLSAFQDEGWP